MTARAPSAPAAPARAGLRRELAEELRFVLGRPELRAITACTALTNLLWAAAGTVHRFLVFGGLGDRPPSWAVAGATLASRRCSSRSGDGFKRWSTGA
jgi:hypothetical protein